LVSSLFTILFAWYWGVLAGIIALFLSNKFQSGKSIKQIADVRIADVRTELPDLYVDSVYIKNVGLKEDMQAIRENAVGLILTPKNKSAKVTIANLGQRQALLHNLSTVLGVYRDSGEPALVPMAKLNLENGDLAMLILPKEKDYSRILQVVEGAPVLENAIRLPSDPTPKSEERRVGYRLAY